jgi:phenylpyruvate tautomerase PptA (4-oxalocrotonate tautomerase family)
MRTGRSAATRDAICDSIHRAMHETFDVPDDNEFIAITEHEAANYRYSESYLGIERSDDVVMIQITANDTRTLAQKKALFQRTAELLVERAGLRPQDVFINLVEVRKENWSLGNGLAQYAS